MWLIVVACAGAGILAGVLLERSFGAAAKRAAKFEADLVQARTDLMRYREETKGHFGKTAELLGRMATDYRELVDHFVTGAEQLCGSNLTEINANGLDRPLLEAESRPLEPMVTAPAASEPPTDEFVK